MVRPASLPQSDAQDRIHVVLVEPGESLNVGAVARAMSNLGFSNLHLVAPPRYDPARAAVMACWATDLLAQAQIHDTLDSALASMEHVVGFTARHGKNRPRHILLPEWSTRMVQGPHLRTALLFGAEDEGLRREHLPYCHWLVRIPSNEANPSYNLSQSVLLALFELSRQRWSETPAEMRQVSLESDYVQLDRLVEDVLTRARFFKDGTPEPIPGLVKHLLRRIEPDNREMNVLLGMFGKISRALAGKVPVAVPEQSAPEPGDLPSAAEAMPRSGDRSK